MIPNSGEGCQLSLEYSTRILRILDRVLLTWREFRDLGSAEQRFNRIVGKEKIIMLTINDNMYN